MGEWPWLILIGVGLAYLFDFYNGFNDAANAIATVVATRVLRPLHAVVWAALWNFVAYFLFGVAVATTIASGIVNPAVMEPPVVLAGLVGAIVWTALATRFGLPISASHALIGGVVGSAVAYRGVDVLLWTGLSWVLVFIVLAPVLGMLMGGALMVLNIRLFWRASPARLDRWFRVLQLASSAAYSVGHGGNDAQKTAGIITLLLFTGGILQAADPPAMVVFASYAVIAVGTAVGGWRVIRTLGTRITQLRPIGGFCAETGGALTLFGTAALGIPASTTHTITGAILGVGAVRRLSAVRWGVTMQLIWAWILTIPFAAAVAALTFLLFVRPFL